MDNIVISDSLKDRNSNEPINNWIDHDLSKFRSKTEFGQAFSKFFSSFSIINITDFEQSLEERNLSQTHKFPLS